MSRKRDHDGSGDEVESGDENDLPPSDDDAAAARDDGDEGEEDGDEEGDEDDRQDRGRQKKRRKTSGALNLIDEEAEEDDDADDDEEDDDGYGGVKGLIADGSDDEGMGARRDEGREAMRVQRLRREQDLKGEDARDVVRRIEERWANKEDEDDAEDGADGAPLDSAGVDQQGLQPTIRDPRLFVLKCRKPGYERRAILTLLQKMFDLQARGVDIGILSAVAPEHLKGFLYIEAYSSSQVEQAIRGLDLIVGWDGIKPLSLDEMTDVLAVGKRLDKQERGNWVRIQRGVYKGDLAQVYSVPEGGADTQIMVRMIPRLRYRREDGDEDDYEDEDEEYEDVEYDNDPSTALGKSAKGRKKTKKRAPQKLFDAREASRLFSSTGNDRVFNRRDQFTGEVFDSWNDELYRLGLLYKKVSTKTLLINDAVIPTPDELEKWAAAETRIRLLAKDPETASMVEAQDLKDGLFLKEAALRSKRKTTIFKGDTVSIVQGEQSGLSGTVVGFDGGIVLIQEPGSTAPVRASRADVVKTFKVGDHVKVTAGKHAGHGGVLVVVNGDALVMFTDSTCEEIRVTAQQVSDSNDLATDELVAMAVTGKQLQLFEMVYPVHDRDAKGVVVGIQGERVSVLGTQNTVNEYPLSDVRHVARDAYTQALDCRGNKLSRNIALHVTRGPLKDRTGIIIEVCGNTVFFKGSDEVRNCGILAVASAQCEAQAAAARTLDRAGGEFKMPAPVPRAALPSLNGGMGGILAGGRGRGGMGGGGRGFNRDPLKDKDVKIIKGPYKGHFGKVIDANEKTIRVELTSKMKNVTLSRDKVKDLSPDAPAGGFGLTGLGGGARGGGFQAAPGAGGGGGFPSFGGGGAGGRTPLHGSGMTPHGGRTPLNFGGRTPVGGGLSAFGGLGNRTPSHGGAFGAGNRTPAHPGFGGLPAPRTPAHTAFRPTTPARADEYGGFGSFGGPPAAASANPYATYSAPVPTTPGTPHMLPVTPAGGGYGAHAADPRTPADPSMVPQTPVDQYSMPQTPQMAMEPQTPLPYGDVHTPGGPVGVPQTPATPEPSTPMPETPAPMDEPATPAPGQEGDVASQGYKVLIDVVVSVPDMNGRSAVVTNAAFDGAFVNVSMLDTGEQVVLNGQQFTPVQPAIEEGADNLVKVLDGAFAGRIGRLASMDARDGVACGTIDFGGGEVHVLDMEFVAKYRRAG